MNTNELRKLLQQAGNYPSLENVGSKGTYYECPLCGGDGSIPDDFISEGTETVGTGIDCSIVGIQVYGIGDAMTAMANLVPLAIKSLPALLDAFDQVESLKKEIEQLKNQLTNPNQNP